MFSRLNIAKLAFGMLTLDAYTREKRCKITCSPTTITDEGKTLVNIGKNTVPIWMAESVHVNVHTHFS